MDNLVWDRSAENLRFPIEVRDSNLGEILSKDSWILEGVQYNWGIESFNKADLIFVLKPHTLVRDYRVLRRFIRTRIGIERWNYKQSFKNLYKMIVVWNRGYDREGFSKIIELTDSIAEKRVVVRNLKEIESYMEKHHNGLQKTSA